MPVEATGVAPVPLRLRLRDRVKRVRAYVRAFGLLRGPYLLAKIRAARRGLVRIDVPALGAPIFVRPRTSDKPTFEQVFVFGGYDTAFITFRPEVIVDAGANAGFATRFLAQRYPWARIVAIEPEPSNFELLRRNTGHLKTVVPLQAALWNRPASLRIENPLDDKWAFRVEEAPVTGPAHIRGITVQEAMECAGSSRVDILKLDIEGAEKELFESGYDTWLNRVNAIIVELHDRLRPGCSDAFYRAIRGHDFTRFQRGEHVILVRQGRLA
jgi:FkbM family methyltransferase